MDNTFKSLLGKSMFACISPQINFISSIPLLSVACGYGCSCKTPPLAGIRYNPPLYRKVYAAVKESIGNKPFAAYPVSPPEAGCYLASVAASYG
jgi:hypothetical protein